jgi:hypothetical protein
VSESTTELAVHLAAAAQGADAARLCDSAAFMNRVAGLSPDTPGFVGRVAEAVREAAQVDSAYRTGVEQPTTPAAGQQTSAETPSAPLTYNEMLAHRASRRAQLTPDFAGEITMEDLQLAEPSVVAAWATAGKLEHLGVPRQKQRGRR